MQDSVWVSEECVIHCKIAHRAFAFRFEGSGSVSLMLGVSRCLPITLFQQTGFDGYQQDLIVIMPVFVCLF